MSGAEHPSSLRVRANIGNQTILILLDSGSSHSFIDSALLSRIGLTPTPLPIPQSVKVASGAYMACKSEVKNLEWWVQSTNFSYDVKVLELGGYDLIPGMDWLEQCGEMTCQWKQKWISFTHQGQEVKLQGILQTEVQHIHELSLEQVIQWHHENEIWALALMEPAAETSVANTPAKVQQLLSQYDGLFAEPDSLPPSRAYDHAIHLLPSVVPVNSRPYRYSPLQKDEIERQVKKNDSIWNYFT